MAVGARPTCSSVRLHMHAPAPHGKGNKCDKKVKYKRTIALSHIFSLVLQHERKTRSFRSSFGSSRSWSHKQTIIIPRNALRWGYSNAAVVPSVHGSARPSGDYTVSYFFVQLGRHVNHDERINPIDLGGQRSRSQWTYMEISLWTQSRQHHFIFLCQTLQTC